MTVTEAAEACDRGTKQTRYIELFFWKGKSLRLDAAALTKIFCKKGKQKDTIENAVIDFRVSYDYDGERPISADLEDVWQTLKDTWNALITKHITNGKRIEKAWEVKKNFEKRHKEKLDESYIHDTIDK